jgi:hypothetical protein
MTHVTGTRKFCKSRSPAARARAGSRLHHHQIDDQRQHHDPIDRHTVDRMTVAPRACRFATGLRFPLGRAPDLENFRRLRPKKVDVAFARDIGAGQRWRRNPSGTDARFEQLV